MAYSVLRPLQNIDTILTKKMTVFGIHIYGVDRIDDVKMLHAAHILAEYLDNDGDGSVDNQALLNTLLQQKATLIMWKDQSDVKQILPHLHTLGSSQDLGNDETNPWWHQDKSADFDAAIEEIWHLITNHGYSVLYPEVFGAKMGSDIAKAMDDARGGIFKNVPTSYPLKAWYSYYDQTCDYECQVTEYFYWGMTSILGAQAQRLDEIGEEWKLNTRTKVQEKDPALYKLLTDKKYLFPTRLPNGQYPHPELIQVQLGEK